MTIENALTILRNPLALCECDSTIRKAVQVLLVHYDGQHKINLRLEEIVHEIEKAKEAQGAAKPV
jgi:hypothetical protein